MSRGERGGVFAGAGRMAGGSVGEDKSPCREGSRGLSARSVRSDRVRADSGPAFFFCRRRSSLVVAPGVSAGRSNKFRNLFPSTAKPRRFAASRLRGVRSFFAEYLATEGFIGAEWLGDFSSGPPSQDRALIQPRSAAGAGLETGPARGVTRIIATIAEAGAPAIGLPAAVHAGAVTGVIFERPKRIVSGQHRQRDPSNLQKSQKILFHGLPPYLRIDCTVFNCVRI